MGDLVTMINNNEISLGQYFMLHPFSATQKVLYNSALSNVNFFNEFYIKTFKTYERLAIICNIIDNAEKNLLVITGYRGCGKTNFLQLIKHIYNEGALDESLYDLFERELQFATGLDELRTNIKNKYNDSLNKIKSINFLSNQFSDITDSEINIKLNDYISNRLKGKVKYINFDEGGMGRDKPFSEKIFYIIRKSIDESLSYGTFEETINLIKRFTNRNKWIILENFESATDRKLKKFYNIVIPQIDKVLNGETIDELHDLLYEELKKLELAQLLFVYAIWEYADVITTNTDSSKKRIMCLLDNIDMISDETSEIFQNTILGIWKFMWDARVVFSQISEKPQRDDLDFLSMYKNTKIIISMRETTAMHISGHLRDKMRDLMEHFDMSTDIDKAMIIQNKIDYAKKQIKLGTITNQNFIKSIYLLENIISDRILIKNIFLLFNNDFRTAMSSITTIIVEHINEIEHAIKLIKSSNGWLVFGGRGIIYRIFIDAFFGWSYFSSIGVSSPIATNAISQAEYGYSCARIILTILCNKQSKNTERFFVNPEESVKLTDLYSMVKEIISLDDFVNIIDGMYSLRNKRFWNHLITFDNIWTYTASKIKQYLIDSQKTDKNLPPIYIRATPAGQMFVATLSTHFEYISSRFCNYNKYTPLFTLDLANKKNISSIKRIINDVYDNVKLCCKSLEKYNLFVLKALNKKHYNEILGTPYYYESQFHEERIIHNHISYLESYRHYILSSKNDTKDVSDINNFIIETIKKYLNLLKYDIKSGFKTHRDLFISNNSKYLFNELNVCIEQIENSKNSKIQITRQYYNDNYLNKRCKMFEKEGIELDYYN